MSAYVQIADGVTLSSANSAVVATGTGGSAGAGTTGAFGANVTAGNYLDVLAFTTQPSYALTGITFGGTAVIGAAVGGAPIDSKSDGSNLWYRYLYPITGSGTCTVTGTFSQVSQNLFIAAVEYNFGFTPGNIQISDPATYSNVSGGTNFSAPALTPVSQPGVLANWQHTPASNSGGPPTAAGGTTANSVLGWKAFSTGAATALVAYCSEAISALTTLTPTATSSGFTPSYLFAAYFSAAVASANLTPPVAALVLAGQTPTVVRGTNIIPSTA